MLKWGGKESKVRNLGVESRYEVYFEKNNDDIDELQVLIKLK